MDKISQWTLAVSAVSAICGVLVSLLPKSSNKNLYKVITVIILIYAFLQPFIGTKGIDFNISDFISDNYSVSGDIDKYALSSILNSAEKAIEELFYEEAQKFNIDCKFKCECIISDEKISVEKIIIDTKLNESEINQIEDIAKSLGLERNIIYYMGEDDEH